MKTIYVIRAGRQATVAELEAAVEGRPLPPSHPTYEDWDVSADGVIIVNSKVVGGVLCRWWGSGPTPAGVAVIDAAAKELSMSKANGITHYEQPTAEDFSPQVAVLPTDTGSIESGPPPLPKPPLGAEPRQIWLEKRAHNLARAIHEYIGAGLHEPVAEWTRELADLWTEIEKGRR